MFFYSGRALEVKMLFFVKRLLVLFIVIIASLNSALYAGKKKNLDAARTKKQSAGQMKKQSLDAVLAEIKVLDEQKKIEREAAQQKELSIQREHEKKYPLTSFIGSSYKEQKAVYHKRLKHANSLLENIKKQLRISYAMIRNVYEQQLILNTNAFSVTKDDIVWEISSETAEGVALMLNSKPVINGGKALFQQKFTLKNFEQRISFKEMQAYEQMFMKHMSQEPNSDVFNIAYKLIMMNRYYCRIVQEKQLAAAHKKALESINECPVSGAGANIFEKNLSGIVSGAFTNHLKLYCRDDKIVPHEVLESYNKICNETFLAINEYHEKVKKELDLIVKELQAHSAQPKSSSLSNIDNKKKLEAVVTNAAVAAVASNKDTIKPEKQDCLSSKLLPDSLEQMSAMPSVMASAEQSVKQEDLLDPKNKLQKSYREAAGKCSDKIVSSEIKPVKFIKSYLRSTIHDWFNNPDDALKRSAEKYPQSNKTCQQQQENVLAHTHPFEMDEYVRSLATHTYRLGNGSTEYYVPGSIVNNKTKEEKTGYFSYVVKDSGLCIHRSFTLRNYTHNNIEEVLHPHPLQLVSEDHEEIFDGPSIICGDLKILQSNLALHFVTDQATYKMCRPLSRIDTYNIFGIH